MEDYNINHYVEKTYFDGSIETEHVKERNCGLQVHILLLYGIFLKNFFQIQYLDLFSIKIINQ